MLYVCKLEYCPENERFSDILKTPEICAISGAISFVKSFGNLCSKKLFVFIIQTKECSL